MLLEFLVFELNILLLYRVLDVLKAILNEGESIGKLGYFSNPLVACTLVSILDVVFD